MTEAPERQPHPSPAAEITIQDLEVNKGWRATRDPADGHFRLECPDGRFAYDLPAALAPGERWNDHFRRVFDGHREACGT